MKALDVIDIILFGLELKKRLEISSKEYQLMLEGLKKEGKEDFTLEDIEASLSDLKQSLDRFNNR